MLDAKFKKILSIALLALTACGSESAQEARNEAAKAVEATKAAVQEHATAAAESAKAATAAAKAKAGEAADKLADSRDAAKQQIGAAASAALRFAADTKEDLDVALGAELERLDGKKAELDAKLAAASEDVRSRFVLFAAAVDVKRSIFDTKASEFSAADDDAWVNLQPGLESSLANIEKSIDKASQLVDKAIEDQSPSGPSADWHPAPPRELFEIVKVVDGDTIHIMRNGKKEKLRLLSVDTEEKLSGQPYSEAKPETLYGEETKLWAIDLFAALEDEDGVSHLGLLFPNGEEEYDVYGRLLCEVILPDGTDYDLQLVKEGRSPYFMKYGYSRICHAAFEAAELEAREKKLGIWNPDCNKPAAEGEPWHKRNYDEIIPWWRARADAVEAFRQQQKANPESAVSAEDQAGMEAAVKRCDLTGYMVSVFGVVDRTFDEDDGSLTLLFRTPKGQTAFRAHIPAALRANYEKLDLQHRNEALRQNYLFAVGKLVNGERGFDITITDAHSLRLGAPDPVIPEAK